MREYINNSIQIHPVMCDAILELLHSVCLLAFLALHKIDFGSFEFSFRCLITIKVKVGAFLKIRSKKRGKDVTK